MAEKSAHSPSLKKPWILTVSGAIGIIALLVLPFLPLYKGGAEMPDFARWIGHFHPVILHLPIGIFMLVVLQEVFGFMRNNRDKGVGFPLTLGVLSSIAAVITGYLLLRHEDGAYGEIGESHMWGGIVFTCAAISTAVVKKWALLNGWMVISYKVPLIASVGIMTFASHDGGSMTHGKGFLTKHAPAPIKAMLGIEEKSKVEEKVEARDPADFKVYADLIQPIFNRRCVDCHREGKAKSGLRMDTYEMVMDGDIVDPGDADRSDVIYFIELPLDDEEHMPPEGNPQVTPEELQMIRWWIDEGAQPEVKIVDAEMPAEIAALVEGLLGMPAPVKKAEKPHALVDDSPDQALRDLLKAINAKYPGTLTFQSQNSSDVVLSAVSLRGKMTDVEFADFEPVIEHLVSADLGATAIGDSSVKKLRDASELKMLRLGETEITDQSVETLAALSELESLNLYGTAITDETLVRLATLPKLKKLYLWQTEVTEEGVQTFKERLPECEVVMGVE